MDSNIINDISSPPGSSSKEENDGIMNQFQETLYKIENNDPSLNKLTMGHLGLITGDFAKLGSHIATNTHLSGFTVDYRNSAKLDDVHTDFFEGIKTNSSIRRLYLFCGHRCMSSRVIHETLKAYQTNNNLTRLIISEASSFQAPVFTTLQRNANLHISISNAAT